MLAEYEDDAWADCLALFRKDIRKMNGGEALTLVDRVLEVAQKDFEGRPTSAIYARFEQWKKENPVQAFLAEDAKRGVMSDEEIARMAG